jgi:hypothetical protein
MPTVGGIVTACYVLRVAELEAGSVGGGWPSFLPRGGGGVNVGTVHDRRVRFLLGR